VDVNQIKMEYCCGIPILIVNCDKQLVEIYYLDDLTIAPIRIKHKDSPWGLTISHDSPHVAVSANSFDITVYNLKTTLIEENQIVLEGHEHNIPCICFSPDNRFIVSTSIDKTTKIWDFKTKNILNSIDIATWGWGVLWIEKDTIKKVGPEDDFIQFFNYVYEDENTQNIIQKIDDYKEYSINWQKSLIKEDSNITTDDTDVLINEDINIPKHTSSTPLEMFPQSRFFDIQVPESTESDEEAFKNLNEKYFIINTTRSDIYLMDCQLNIITSIYSSVYPGDSFFQSQIQRLCLNHYLPEFSTLILASQGGKHIQFIKIQINLETNDYELKPFKTILSPNVISGLTLLKEKGIRNQKIYIFYHLFISFYSKELSYYKITPNWQNQ